MYSKIQSFIHLVLVSTLTLSASFLILRLAQTVPATFENISHAIETSSATLNKAVKVAMYDEKGLYSNVNRILETTNATIASANHTIDGINNGLRENGGMGVLSGIPYSEPTHDDSPAAEEPVAEQEQASSMWNYIFSFFSRSPKN